MAEHEQKNHAIAFVGGLGLGAGLMYMLDPGGGRRRRHLARDKIAHVMHAQASVIHKGARDLENRAHGVAARARQSVQRDEVGDDTLVERVRATIGRCATHPGSIAVTAADGHVTLSGPIFEDELRHLVHRVERVRGVHDVENRLEPHATAEDVPGLQGQPRHLPRPLLLRQSWTPAVRVGATAAGLGLCGYGLERRGVLGGTALLAGSAMLLRAIWDEPLGRVLGLREGQYAVRIQKTIHVAAPVAEVFELWRRFESFPLFMEHVREVRVTEEGRSHWETQGPAGMPIRFDAELTRLVPNEVIAWRTLPGSLVAHAGTVHFEPEDGGTRCQVDMSYSPPGGVLGHIALSLLGGDPKRRMDDDLLRMKTLIEKGVTRAHGERVTRDDIGD